GSWRRPHRCHPRVRGVQAAELSDQEVQAQQSRSHRDEQVLPVVPQAHRASRDPV
ncbi:MAG: LSU ribosomal protein L33p @ LSU ribosomal protein L33p, zinc-dependent, partial [uncultured Solirubrobacteraceae bacterium]